MHDRRVVARLVAPLFAALIACVSMARASAAQEPSVGRRIDVAAGAGVRVSAARTDPLVGTLTRDGADSLVVELPGGSAISMPRARVTRFEVSTGIERHGRRGAGIGLLAGGGIGAAIALATYRRSDCGDSFVGTQIVCPLVDQVSREVTVIQDVALLGTAGTIVGALIGHVARERWATIPLDAASACVRRAVPNASARRVGALRPFVARGSGAGVSLTI